MSDNVVERSWIVGGLDLSTYVLERSFRSTKPIAVLFFLHGRGGNTNELRPIIHSLFKYLEAESTKGSESKPSKDLLIVTFDQRNHGHRLRADIGNKGWGKDSKNSNKQHALDMYAIQTGTANDVSWLIDFLPPYLFPEDERQITEWMVAGISLGGHSTWIVLKNEPRVKIGFPIIGCPDYLKLMEARAIKHSLRLEPPIFPRILREYVEKNDPASCPITDQSPQNPFMDKKIHILSGKEDPLVIWDASREFMEKLDVGENGEKVVFLEDGVGHECSDKMVEQMSQSLWKWCLNV
jgi:predicted esterase